MNYSRAIRVVRSLADLSQVELADRAAIDRSYLSLIESGKRKPTVETVEKIAAALKIPVHLLVLLGAEQADSAKVNAEQIRGLSKALMQLLMHAEEHGQEESSPESTADKLHPAEEHRGTRVSARGKTRRVAPAS